MRQVKLGILGTDQSYVISLMNYMNADRKNPIFAMAFSSEASLKEYLQKQILDVLLYEDGMEASAGEVGRDDSVCMIRLVEQEDAADQKSSIYRYLSADEILQQIGRIIRAREADCRRELFHTYAVISPVDRSGKTRLAKSICLMDEVRGGLYVGMEAFGTIQQENVEQRNTRQYTMSEFAYLIKIRSEQISEYLENGIVSDGKIGMIVSPESYLDLKELDYSDVQWFIKKIIEYGHYTSIVFDIDGSVLNDISILGIFDQVYVPVCGGKCSEGKIETFKSLLQKKDLPKVLMRMKTVEVPDGEYDCAEMMRTAGRLMEA